MTRIGKFLSMMTLAWGMANVAGAAAPNVRVEGGLDRRQAGVGEEFVFTVSVISGESVNPEDPTIPNLDGLKVVNSNTSSSTSSNMRAGPNGWQIETSQRYDFSYMMVPLRKGTLTIPPFTVRVNSETYRTKPVSITVVDAGTLGNHPGNNRGQMNPPGGFGGQGFPPDDLLDDPDELFKQLLQRRNMIPPSAGTLPTNPNEVLHIQTEVDKKEVYEGEQVTVNWWILVKGNLLSLDRTKFPDLKGFWKEIIEEVPALQFSQEVINGQVYRKALLASHALFPIKPGTAVIDEYRIKGRVQVSNGLGFGQDYPFTRASDRITIKVLPLPADGKPKDFSGAVGQFQVQAQLDNNVVPAHQPMSLKIRFEGSGNAKLIEMPEIAWPEGLEHIETKTESRFFKNGQSYKQFDFILIPRKAGDIPIPPISVSLFNPQSKQYYNRTLENVVLKVVDAGGAPPTVNRNERLSDKKPEVPKPLTLPPPLLQAESRGFFSTLNEARVGVLAGLYLVVALVLGLRAWNLFSGRTERKDLQRLLQRKLKRAEAAVQKGDYRQFGVEMVNIYAEVLGEMSGQGGSHREIEKMLELGPPSLRRDYGDEILKQVNLYQTLAFAPDELLSQLKGQVGLSKSLSEGRQLLKTAIDAFEGLQGN